MLLIFWHAAETNPPNSVWVYQVPTYLILFTFLRYFFILMYNVIEYFNCNIRNIVVLTHQY